MDDDDVGENCGWVNRVSWTSIVFAGDAAIPVSWFESQGLVELRGSVEVSASADPDAARHTTAEEYVAGTDPKDPESVLHARIEIVAGLPVVTWDPDLLGDRTYRVLGKKTLNPLEEREDVTDLPDVDTAGYRFFKAKVSMPEE